MLIALLQPHTHGGINYLSGSVIDLSDVQAHWLIEAGVARPLTKPKTTNATGRNPDNLISPISIRTHHPNPKDSTS